MIPSNDTHLGKDPAMSQDRDTRAETPLAHAVRGEPS